MLTVWNAFNDMFNDEFWGRPVPGQRTPQQNFVPRVDIGEDENSYLVSADVPGMKPEEIDIQVENNVLTIRGERKSETRGKQHGYHRVERYYGSFQRSFSLPEGVNAEAIEANVENGTLTLRVPKPATALPKKVKVSVGGLAEKAKKLFSKSADENQPSSS
jgi:HSP20 family protein